MKRKLRIIIPLAVLAVAGIAYAVNAGLGTLSAFGWEDIALICPLGALGTMLATKMVIPRAVVSLVFAVAAIVLLGRAFCGWICPVPVAGKLRDVFKKPQADASKHAGCAHCGHCAPQNSRHLVLGGALLSAAVFGFPVFCLICPIGLSFALVFALIALFGNGDVSWSVVAIPVLLALEVVFFRKWCSHICPISALMSLVGKANRTFLPSVDESKCVETSKDAKCGRCAAVCETGIDPRHPELGADFSECTRCMECVDGCPGSAISIEFLPGKRPSDAPAIGAGQSDSEASATQDRV